MKIKTIDLTYPEEVFNPLGAWQKKFGNELLENGYTIMDGIGTQAPDNLYDLNQLIIYLRNSHKLYIYSNRNYNLLIRKNGQDCVLEITSTSSVKDLMGLSYENELEIFKKYSDLLSTMLIF